MKQFDQDHDEAETSNDEFDNHLDVEVGNVKGTVFLLPLDAPIPLELEDYAPATGPLLERLLPLAQKEPTDDIALVAVSGQELSDLGRSWSAIRVARKVHVLTELPGARDDIMFDMARKQLGITPVPWPSLAEAFSVRKIEKQRTGDSQPWRGRDVAEELKDGDSLPQPKGTNLHRSSTALPVPDDGEVDFDADS
jgi:hypothetical protein